MISLLFVLHLISVTGGSGERIEINIDSIVSIREPGVIKEHFHSSIRCLVFTSDGKFVTTQETCKAIHDILGTENRDEP